MARESAQEHRRYGKPGPPSSYHELAVDRVAELMACGYVTIQRHPSHDYGELTSKSENMGG